MIHTTRFFDISISDLDQSEIAIFSKSTGEFMPLTSKSKLLAKIKKKFKGHISSSKSFCFSNMSEAEKKELFSIIS
jgi:hypothetical protein